MQVLAPILAATKTSLRHLGLLPYAKRFLAWLSVPGGRMRFAQPLVYLFKVAQEKANYANVTEVHDLPPIYHYWSNAYLLPKARQFGFYGPDDFFANHLERSMPAGRAGRFLSIGAGNCDTEIRIAALLRARGRSDFVIECLDLNPSMLERGRLAARQQGVATQLAFLESDFNSWRPAGAYDAVIANQSLHHVLELEHLFASVADAIGRNGRFIISDMIGRNGHQRWPEALAIVQEFWRELPKPYRHNRQLRRHEDVFLDWDCSVSGFEGVRAQDILPLLVERFHFEVFLPFGNVIDPFIDRSFGPNFDPNREWDRAFIDRVHARDERELQAGRIKPTHLFGCLQTQRPRMAQFLEGFTPARAIRHA